MCKFAIIIFEVAHKVSKVKSETNGRFRLYIPFEQYFPHMCAIELVWATTLQNQKNECAPSEDSAWRTRGSLATHWAYSEDSDQTGRRVILLVLSCGGSFVSHQKGSGQTSAFIIVGKFADVSRGRHSFQMNYSEAQNVGSVSKGSGTSSSLVLKCVCSRKNQHQQWQNNTIGRLNSLPVISFWE